MDKTHVQLVWFKRDLRVVDHAPLSQAAERGPVLPLYVAEPGSGEGAQVLVDELDRPTALSVGTDTVWVSVSGGEQARGEGSVVKFALADLLEEKG